MSREGEAGEWDMAATLGSICEFNAVWIESRYYRLLIAKSNHCVGSVGFRASSRLLFGLMCANVPNTYELEVLVEPSSVI